MGLMPGRRRGCSRRVLGTGPTQPATLKAVREGIALRQCKGREHTAGLQNQRLKNKPASKEHFKVAPQCTDWMLFLSPPPLYPLHRQE